MANMNDVDMTDAEELGEGFKAIPPGEYQIYMESSDRQSTKAGDGEYLACIFRVANTEYEGAKIFCNFNFWNKNPDAVRIAKSQWRALCEATVGQPNAINNESASLHNKLFTGLIDNVQGYNKATGKNDHPTMRSNELVFRKGTILSMAQANARGIGGAPAPQAAQAYQAATQAAPANAPAAQPQQTAAPVKPGVGQRPWDRK